MPIGRFRLFGCIQALSLFVVKANFCDKNFLFGVFTPKNDDLEKLIYTYRPTAAKTSINRGVRFVFSLIYILCHNHWPVLTPLNVYQNQQLDIFIDQ